MMDNFRRFWRGEQEYAPIVEESETNTLEGQDDEKRFSYVEYGIFLLLGVSMLWAYNMFLAAGPYFQRRFRSSPWISENFQAAEISVSTTTGLIFMIVLARLQDKASYPARIFSALLLNMFVFTLLAMSTRLFLEVSASGYFAFIMLMNFLSSVATSLCQNGIFAFVTGYGQRTYTQGIMTGQAIAGVLPCVAQIVSVLAVQSSDRQSSHKDRSTPDHSLPSVPSSAALAYFLTATAVSVATFCSFTYLLRSQSLTSSNKRIALPRNEDSGPSTDKKAVPMTILARKLKWLAGAVFMTFAITMVFPVFTQRIVSVRPSDQQPEILRPASFVPLAFLFWNSGDFLGRLLTAIPRVTIAHRPRLVFFLSLSRLVFPMMYMLCNIRGKGAIVNSDLFYLLVVQLFFGATNGYLGSTCMIGIADWVESDEQEAAGGFMALCLVAGLTTGSFASFLVAT